MGSGEFLPLQGMSDISAPEVHAWQRIESQARALFRIYGYDEIRTPVLEKTGVFARAIGEGTDVVQKEMYSFEDRGGRRISLRPEGTAGVIRAICAAGPDAADARWYYLGPMFRSERPQAGRKRQFHQIGVECMGAPCPAADAECIALQLHLLEAWGLQGCELHVHTRGLPEDQAAVRDGLTASLRPHAERLCEECRRRMDTHPLRILDCKNPVCRTVVDGIPPVTSHMGGAARAYLDDVVRLLGRLGVAAAVDGRLVRGLDYYVHTIWEITHPALGAQDALAGGGRYRVEMDGRAIEGVGFAMGVERVLMALQQGGLDPAALAPRLSVWLVSLGDRAREENLSLLQQLRRSGIPCGMDTAGRSMKAQMRCANRAGVPYVAIRGDDEMAAGTVVLKDMKSGTEDRIAPSDLAGRVAGAP